jgi:hypothetical protein
MFLYRMKEPVDHILRPTLPWREPGEGAITECGYDASKVKTLTREDYFRREKELGRQRTAMLTCMTCSDTAHRWGTWNDDPRLALQREIEWERGPGYWRGRSDHGSRLKDELLGIAALIEAHRDEFLNIIDTNEQRRAWLEKNMPHHARSTFFSDRSTPARSSSSPPRAHPWS